MPKLPRVTVRQFGSSGGSTFFGQFGSKFAGAPQTTQNPSIIMQLANWLTGWTAAAIGANFNPFLEDMNGFCFVTFYFLANLFERGIPDWDAGTTYFQGAFVQDPAGSGQRWYSLADNNLNNAPPAGASNAFWKYDNPPAPGSAGQVIFSAGSGLFGAALAAASIFWDNVNLRLGIGTATPTSPLTVNGLIESVLNGFKFPDGSIQTSAARAVSAQAVVTGSRSFNVTYRNTGSLPLFVTVSCDIVSLSSGGSNCQALTDNNLNPTTLVAIAQVGDQNAVIPITFIVLPGNYYKVASGGAVGLSCWTEWT